MISAYFIFAAWFWIADMLAGELADVKPRPIAAAVFALAWPLSMPFSLCASAIIIRRLKQPTTRDGDEGQPSPERDGRAG